MGETASDLCQACGLCCDGTLFQAIRVDVGAMKEAARVRLRIVDDAEGASLGLPCPAHADVCTVYEDRPATCRTYRCELVDRLDAREIDFADAAARVARVKAAIASIRRRLPITSVKERSLRVEIERIEEQPRAWKLDHAELLL